MILAREFDENSLVDKNYFCKDLFFEILKIFKKFFEMKTTIIDLFKTNNECISDITFIKNGFAWKGYKFNTETSLGKLQQLQQIFFYRDKKILSVDIEKPKDKFEHLYFCIGFEKPFIIQKYSFCIYESTEYFPDFFIFQ